MIKGDCLDLNFKRYFGNEEIKTLSLIWNAEEEIFNASPATGSTPYRKQKNYIVYNFSNL